MTRSRAFHQLDVFSPQPLLGNPLAVVHDAADLTDDEMAAFARWTNLSETTFLLPPTADGADYRVRIFTPTEELPFAGHPTLGTCKAWLLAGGKPKTNGFIVQQCGVGLVRLRQDGTRLAFAAPPLRRTGPLDDALIAKIVRVLGLAQADIVNHQWVDNGPGFCAVMLKSADQVLALDPDFAGMGDLKLGVIGAHAPGAEAAFEVRCFIPTSGINEDPVTGSLNAGLAAWMIGAGLAPDAYVVAQGTALRRAGRVHIARDGAGIWIGGDSAVCISGTVTL
jgi:PhzF family phenazine biosynthesis protein